jgi:hypothetical protein
MSKIIRILTLLLILGPTCCQKAKAQGTYTANSCNYSDVNAVINGPTHTAVNGDTINIPSGTCTWTSSLSISVGISIIGAGASSTTIQDGLNGTLFSINIPSASSALMRVSGISLTPASGAGGQPALFNITGTCSSSTCSNIRLDDMSMTGWVYGSNFSCFLIYANDVFGVLDHNTVSFNGGEWISIGHGSYLGIGSNGDNSWATADSYGTANALYIENNTISASSNAITDTDVGGGARFVVRFNTLTNAFPYSHGTESTQRTRGGRQYEVYNNSFTATSGNQINGIVMRSGTGMVFDNTLTASGGQINPEVLLSEYRVSASFSPWGYCAGQGQWDNNTGTVYATGTVSSSTLSGQTLVVTDTTKSWASNEWAVPGAPYSLIDISITDGNGFHPGTEITSSATDSVTSTEYWAWNGGSSAVNFRVGDTYQVVKASSCIDQPGNGGNGATLLSGSTPSPVGWVNEPLDPVYEWGSTTNYGSGSPQGGWVGGNWTIRFAANQNYYSQVSPFTGASGTGTGTLADRPSTCTSGVAYWATDQGNWNQSGSGGQGELFICTGTNTWTLSYTPYSYPHPLDTNGSVVNPPTNLAATVD